MIPSEANYANPGIDALRAVLRSDEWWLERNRIMIALAEAVERQRAADAERRERERNEAIRDHLRTCGGVGGKHRPSRKSRPAQARPRRWVLSRAS